MDTETMSVYWKSLTWLPTSPWAYVAIGIAAVWLGPRAFTFLRAVTSGWNKENVKDRLAICKVCPRVKVKEHVDPEGKLTSYLYCDECKCGSHHIAELHTKLGFYNIQCPMGKFGKKDVMTVHEGHDLLVERSRKEWAEDQRERNNISAGRDRDDDGQQGNNRHQRGNRTTQAQGQLQPTKEAAEAQRTRIQQAREAGQGAQRQETRIAESAVKHAEKTSKIWGDSQDAATATVPDETANTVQPDGADHEGQILVDQKKE